MPGNYLSFFILLFMVSCAGDKERKNEVDPGAWYAYHKDATTRWSSPENLNGQTGAGGKENGAAKGRAYVGIDPGGSATLLDVQGSGIINRIWITVIDRSPQMLRSLRLEMYWDGQDKPAVSVPLGDFFGLGLGRIMPFQNAAFADPEGRSFNCFIPMPFRTGARIVVKNDAEKRLSHLFFDVDFQQLKDWKEGSLYFHAYWNRDTATTLARDFELLPAVQGHGRFLGVNVGLNSNPLYGDAWWGEGEVKMFMNGEKEFPTIVGTGTEDYIGTGWGQSVFSNPFAGCLIADSKTNQWAFYRYHIPDPIYFDSGIRVTLQQLGGNMKSKVLALQKANIPLIPVSLDSGGNAILLYKGKKSLDDRSLPEGWTNFYRSDDVSATTYFYLATPTSGLPALQPLAIRTYQLKTP